MTVVGLSQLPLRHMVFNKFVSATTFSLGRRHLCLVSEAIAVNCGLQKSFLPPIFDPHMSCIDDIQKS